MVKTGWICGIVSAFLVGLVAGYLYGFKAYNRPIKAWEFWLKPSSPFYDWLER